MVEFDYKGSYHLVKYHNINVYQLIFKVVLLSDKWSTNPPTAEAVLNTEMMLTIDFL